MRELPHDEIHVWRASLDLPQEELGRLEATLAPEESARARRFRFAIDRDRFIAARGILREILARYCGSDPTDIRFAYGASGKPALSPGCGPPELRFNVSHARGLALYALAWDREVGVDLELVRTRVPAQRIAERFFAAAEAARLRALPPELRTEGFFNCWTRKEAYIKARGGGLSIPLNSFEVSLAPGEPAVLLEAGHDPDAPPRWSIEALNPAPGYAAALAAEGGGWRVVCLEWNPAV